MSSLASKSHERYFLLCLRGLPDENYQVYDTQRLVIAFFCFAGLDVLQKLEKVSEDCEKITSWIYALQVLPCRTEGSLCCGFRGSSMLASNYEREPHTDPRLDSGTIAMAYTSLASLVILGDDLSRVNRSAILEGIGRLQCPNGSFFASQAELDSGMRFLYCAACVCYILDDWSTVNIHTMAQYIHSSTNYDGGIGRAPFLESHAGYTFCAVAALHLLTSQQKINPKNGDTGSDLGFSEQQRRNLVRWCISRQGKGFNGRPHKDEDTCYSFWVGATLKLLGKEKLVDKQKNREFLLAAQEEIGGGFSKVVGTGTDPMHTYLALAGLSLQEEEGLRPINAALNMSERALLHLHHLHKTWKKAQS